MHHWRETLSEALKLYQGGLMPIPLYRMEDSPNGIDKHPCIKWTKYRDEGYQPHRGIITGWFMGRPRGLSIIGGKVSNGLETLDFDNHGCYGDEFQRWCKLVPPDLLRRLVIYATPSAGYHVCWKHFPGMADRVAVLAKRNEKQVSIELLSQSILLVPGGDPGSHKSGKPYRYIRGHLAETPSISDTERTFLLGAAASLTQWTPPPPKPAMVMSRSGEGSWWASDDFNRRASWEEILDPHGWVKVNEGQWRRPGKDIGISATTAVVNKVDVFWCFSTSMQFTQKGYEKWAVWAVLNCDGDFSAAAQKLARLGYGRANQDLDKLSEIIHRRYFRR